MTSRERVLAALTGSMPDRVPFMDLGVDGKVARAIVGRSDFAPTDVADSLGLDALGFALYPPIYTLNQTSSDGRSYIVGGRLHSRADLSLIDLPDPGAPGFLDGAKRFIDAYAGDRAVFAATNIGLDPLLLSMSLEWFSYALTDDTGLIDAILSRYTEWAAGLVAGLKAVGFDFVWVTDDIAYKDGPMFSPTVFRERMLGPVRLVADQMDLPWVYHSDGNLLPVLDDLLSLGMNGLHPIEPGAMDIVELKARIGREVCLVGNVDVGEVLTLGTPETTRRAVEGLIGEVGPGGRYILSSSNSIASFCRPENVEAMARAVSDFGVY